MSEYLPFELQIKIIEGIPIKSLIRFRSVSKPWKSIIDSSKFIADYNNHSSRSFHQLLVSTYKPTYVSIVDDDDDSFSPNNSVLKVTINKLFNNMIGYSQGLFGFYDYDNSNAVIWNPSISKFLDIPIPNVFIGWPYKTVFGFGVCNATDPMIVKINYIDDNKFESISSIPSQVEVFKLSTWKWISLSDTCRLPRKSLGFCREVVVTEGFIYWLVYDRSRAVDGSNYLMIMSFDMNSERFTEISLPPNLASKCYLDLCKFRESLVVFETNGDGYKQEWGVWMMMEHGGHYSFIKLYTVKKRILGFRKNGQPIIEMHKGYYKDLIVYERGSGHFNDIQISPILFPGVKGSYMYKGTLLLLDH